MNVRVEQTSAETMPVELGEHGQDTHPRSGRRKATRPGVRRVGALVASLVLAGVGTVTASTAATAGSDEPIVDTRAPAASTSQAGDVSTKAWYVKNAKNVSGAPSSKLVCTFVRSHGGSQTHGKACFQPKGDIFWVQDRRADGLNIVMRATPKGNFQIIRDCRDYKGKRAGWTACNFNMKENQTVNFNVIAYKGTDRKYTGIDVDSSN